MFWDSSTTPSVAYDPMSTEILTSRVIANIAITATYALYTATCRKYPLNETIYKVATAALGLWGVVTYPYIVEGCGYLCMDDAWPSDHYGEIPFTVLKVCRGFLACTALFHFVLWGRDIILYKRPASEVIQSLDLAKKAATQILPVCGCALLILTKCYHTFTDTPYPLALSLPVRLSLVSLFWHLSTKFKPAEAQPRTLEQQSEEMQNFSDPTSSSSDLITSN